MIFAVMGKGKIAMAEYVAREELIKRIENSISSWGRDCNSNAPLMVRAYKDVLQRVKAVPSADVLEVKHEYEKGDVCLYGFANGNKSLAVVEIVDILDDDRGVAKVKFLKVIVDNTGNGFFHYCLHKGETMNASFKYLKNIMPCTDGD